MITEEPYYTIGLMILGCGGISMVIVPLFVKWLDDKLRNGD